MQPRQDRGGAPQLAVPPRSANRRLRGFDPPLSIVTVAAIPHLSAIPQDHRRLLARYRMPPEWAPHLACYLVWPHNRDTWPGKFEVIPPIYADMVAAIAEFEPVRLMVNDEAQIDEVRAMIRDSMRRPEKEKDLLLSRIDIFHLPTNDSWARDHGPIFVNRIATAAS